MLQNSLIANRVESSTENMLTSGECAIVFNLLFNHRERLIKEYDAEPKRLTEEGLVNTSDWADHVQSKIERLTSIITKIDSQHVELVKNLPIISKR